MNYFSVLGIFPVLIFQIVKTEVCGSACHALVSGKYGVPDTALTASTMWDANLGPPSGRLHSPASWSPNRASNNEWLQVKFNYLAKVFTFQTKGRQNFNQCITSYIVQTSEDCETFKDYMEHGKTKVFTRSANRFAVATHTLLRPLRARCFRIVVKGFYHYPSMRFEVIGRRECPRGYSLWKESCYALVQDLFSWVEADAYCRRGGGSLVTVENQEEQTWLLGFISNKSPRYTTVRDRSCVGKSLQYIKSHSLLLCLHYCREKTTCTAVTTKLRGSTTECWLRAGCHVNLLVEDQGINTHLMMSRASDIWINMNRVFDHSHWMTKPEQRALYFHWALGYPSIKFQENCVAITPFFKYKWINKKCKTEATFVCEN